MRTKKKEKKVNLFVPAGPSVIKKRKNINEGLGS